MKREIRILIAGGVLFAAALLLPAHFAVARFVLFFLAFLVGGEQVIQKSFKGICRGNVFNENTLMVIAAVGAFCIREYPEAVFVVLFYRIGELFEDYAVRRSRNSIREVMDICPKYANLLTDGVVTKVDPEEVQVGQTILVAAGERIPLDGIVTEGCSYVDTAALTGESVPRMVMPTDPVISGCINQNGVLTVKVTKAFEDSTVSRILELVETASARKSTSERFITRFAKYYTPVVLICALLLAVVPSLVLEGASFQDYLYRALSFLVVSCPCALVISVPLAFFGGIGGAAKKGILIKGGNYLEALSTAENMVFDKTGTLTKGTFSVRAIETVQMGKEQLLELAAHAEQVSRHPIAQSIRNVWNGPVSANRVRSSQELPGYGVKAVVDGKTVLAGNEKLMADGGITCHSSGEGAWVFVAVDGCYAGRILIADEIKEDAPKGIQALKATGIRETYMLSGDRAANAEAVAQCLGMDGVQSELLPDEKVQALEKIMSKTKGKTAYVGDGINDAPVLARADIGIAMGALGADAAVEAADIVIMTDEIGKLETAVRIAKKTMSIARQNILFSLVVKIGILILCSFNAVGMGVAVFGDVGVMILAVLNSFRAMK